MTDAGDRMQKGGVPGRAGGWLRASWRCLRINFALLRRSPWSFVAGYDAFVSYARADAFGYAGRLANLLEDAGLAVFVDQLGTPATQQVHRSVIVRCARARMLVVVGSEASERSGPMLAEVLTFPRQHRPVVVIQAGFDEARAEWWPLVKGTAVLVEPGAASTPGDEAGARRMPALPDDAVASKVHDAVRFARRSAVQRASFATLLTAIAIAGGVVALQLRAIDRLDESSRRAADLLAQRQRQVQDLQRDIDTERQRLDAARLATGDAYASAALQTSQLTGQEWAALRLALLGAGGGQPASTPAAAASAARGSAAVHAGLLAAVVAARRSMAWQANDTAVDAIELSADGHWLVTSDGMGGRRRWDLRAQQAAGVLTMPPGVRPDALPALCSVTLPASALAGQRSLLDRRVDVGWNTPGWLLVRRREPGGSEPARLWSLRTRRCVAEFDVPASEGLPRMSTDGSRLAYWGRDRMAHVVDVSHGAPPVEVWSGPAQWPGIRLSPQARRALVWTAEGLDCIDLASGSRTLHAQPNPMLARFLDDQVALLDGDPPQDAPMLWDCATGGVVRLQKFNEPVIVPTYRLLPGHLVEVQGPKPDLDSLRGQRPSRLRIWDRRTGALRHASDLDFPGATALPRNGGSGSHPPRQEVLPLSATVVAVSGGDGDIRVLDVETGSMLEPLHGHQAYVSRIAALPSQELLVSGAMDGTARLWRLRDGQRLRTLPPITKEDLLFGAALEAGARHLALRSGDGVDVWDLALGRIARHVRSGDRDGLVSFVPGQPGVLPLPDGSGLRIADGSRVAAAGLYRRHVLTPDRTLIVGRLRESEPRLRVVDPQGRVVAASSPDWNEGEATAISPDRREIATADRRGIVRVRDSITLRERVQFPGHGEIFALDYSPDGRFILGREIQRGSTGSSGWRLWDAATGRHLLRIRAADTSVVQAAFSADGHALVYLCADGDLRSISLDAESLAAQAFALSKSFAEHRPPR